MKNLPEEIETSIKDILKNELVLVRNEFSF